MFVCRAGEDCLPKCLTRKHAVTVMIRGCNATGYIHQVLEPKLLPTICNTFGDAAEFIFQQDGAQCHTTHQCVKWFQDNNSELLTRSHLNSIQNLWSHLKTFVESKHPSNKQELVEGITNQLMVPHHIF